MKKGRPRKFNDSKRVCLLMNKELINSINRAKRFQSAYEGVELSFSDMVRKGLEEAFPYNKTRDLF